MMRIIALMIFTGIIFSSSYGKNHIYQNYGRPQMKDTTSENIIIDSDYNIDEALNGIPIPPEIKKNLILIEIQYYSFDHKLHQGQLVINKQLRSDLIKIFKRIKQERFPVEKAVPIVYYNWNDEKSMADNNTSAFNYRFIAGTKKLSNHSYGTAIDINPLFNPYIRKDLRQPEGSVYNPSRKGTITGDSFLVKEFRLLGWDWGGNWINKKDYQHFEKELQ